MSIPEPQTGVERYLIVRYRHALVNEVADRVKSFIQSLADITIQGEINETKKGEKEENKKKTKPTRRSSPRVRFPCR